MTAEDDSGSTSLGVYGLRLTGLPGAESLLNRVDPRWPELDVVMEPGRARTIVGHVDDDSARVVFTNGGQATVDRLQRRVTFAFPQAPAPGEVVHPYLAPVAAVMARWNGREPFHAGGFMGRSGVWGVLADREGGKSSTLARLALEGVPIVCDDVLVIEEDTALAGPRAIDLREGPARALGVGDPLGVVGTRERWRMSLVEIEATLPLAGWVHLTWADGLALERLPVSSRLRRLAEQRAVALTPTDPGLLLRLAALPSFELRRPRAWSSLDSAVNLLLTSLP